MNRLSLFLNPRYATLCRSLLLPNLKFPFGVALILLLLSSGSCTKDQDSLPPVVRLLAGDEYTTDHSVIPVYKDPNSTWGGIRDHTGITLGYQENTEIGHFLDPSTGAVYSTDSAALFQDLIDVAVYYFVDEGLPYPTFSSPGEQGGGIEACHNDSLLTLSYDDVWGKRKFKWANQDPAGTIKLNLKIQQ